MVWYNKLGWMTLYSSAEPCTHTNTDRLAPPPRTEDSFLHSLIVWCMLADITTVMSDWTRTPAFFQHISDVIDDYQPFHSRYRSTCTYSSAIEQRCCPLVVDQRTIRSRRRGSCSRSCSRFPVGLLLLSITIIDLNFISIIAAHLLLCTRSAR